MRIRGLSIIFGAMSATLLLSAGAQAAITVLGSGPAEECFKVAEFGGSAREAISTCSFALHLDLSTVDRAATYVNRGVLHLRINQNDEALTDMNQGIAIAPELGDAYVDRGAVMIALGHYDEALADLNKGISLTPHRPQVAYFDRAIVNEHAGDIRGAYEDYKKALELEPGFTPAVEQLKRFKVVRKNEGA